MDESFLSFEKNNSKEAKFNMFRFHEHLLSWINTSSVYFQQRQYPDSFEALTVVYTDSYGFFAEKDQNKADGLFEECLKENNKYINYNIQYSQIRRKVANHAYKPPKEFYTTILKFRKELMKLLTKYQLLIPQVKKGQAGAAEA